MTRSLLLISFTAACSSATPGARPHDMSATQHEAAAREHERAAEGYAGQYESSARSPIAHCQWNSGARSAICWNSVENPTAEHLRAADNQRRRAAEHRAASQALRDTEARACAGLADADRDVSPFERVEDIASVEPLREQVASAKLPRTEMVGAIVTFRAVPGLTPEWLQRVVDCHLARNAALGHVVPDMPDCPLVPKGVTARVSSVGSGFAVAIRGNSDAVAREVLERARRLRSPTITSRSAGGAP